MRENTFTKYKMPPLPDTWYSSSTSIIPYCYALLLAVVCEVHSRTVSTTFSGPLRVTVMYETQYNFR